MIIKSWDELRRADERTLHFTPHGLGLDRQLTPESSAEFQQQVVAGLELAPEVAEGTRQSFDRLRTVFAYGVLCYDLFTLVNDHALLVIEQALRDRFIDYHQGKVVFVHPNGAQDEVGAERYEQVHEALKSHRPPWQLRVGGGPRSIQFNGTLHGLRTWSRAAGLLPGQRSRGVEGALSRLRNFVAHPTSYHLLGPVEAARMLSDLREIINQLWGAPTPGGRLFPGPVHRNVVAIAWAKDGNGFAATAAENLRDPSEVDEDWDFAIVRTIFEPGRFRSDPELAQFDSLYEATWYPTDLLWGPGARQDGAAWLDANAPEPDTCHYLDRLFLLRHEGGELYLPMRPAVAAALPVEQQTGQWFAIRADFPNDAFAHVRQAVSTPGSQCTKNGPC